MRPARSAVAALAALALSACAGLPERPPLAAETALPPATAGPLYRETLALENGLAAGASAHWLLDGNELALEARLALTDSAAGTLDIQYFIWQSDASGRLLASHLLAAADRGVKVRLLLDGLAARRGVVADLDAHPGIEVRVFNPWASRGSVLGIALNFLVRPRILNRRMHNKIYVADGRFAIVGGRNIGDRYFGLYPKFVQNDLDILVGGPVVREVGASFDLYWNDANAYPLAVLRDGVPPLATTREGLAESIAANAERLGSFPLEPADWTDLLARLAATYAPGASEAVYDTPDIRDVDRPRLYEQLLALVGSAERDVLISSPYFIPDRRLRDLLTALVARGVRVRVVTNSLATNNHVIAHSAYKHWRREILRSGVELYELREDAAVLGFYDTPPVTAAALGLHTKAIVVDGRRSFVGSPNIDPRSLVINTEIGVVVDSEAFGRELGDLIARDMEPENAWRVTLDADGWLDWESGGRHERRQPARGFAQRAIEFFLNLLPLKSQA